MSSYFSTVRFCPSTVGTCPAQGAEANASSSVPACTLTGGSCGSSVQLSSGAFSFRLNLLSISAINGVSWSFGLDYLAGNGVDDILGMGFNYTQNLRLVSISGGVQLASGGNTLDTFTTSDGITYTADEYNCTQAVLTRSGSGASDQFTLTASDGAVTVFAGFASGVSTPGRLISVTDRFGNSQSYTWTTTAGISQLVSVTDSYGRTINYSYYGAEFGYCLQQITDFLGRQLNFQYDGYGHLAAVVMPSINQGVTGNTFPGGTAYAFLYDVTNIQAARQNDLIKIWFPNEAAPFIDPATRTVDLAGIASATPRYVVTYGQDSSDPDSWGLVTNEIIGNPTGGVGGTYDYDYDNSPSVTNLIDSGDSIVFECMVTDRNGNKVVYDFNGGQMPVRVEAMRNRGKISLPSVPDSYVTWTAYNLQNQPTARVMPEGNSTQWTYETGIISGISGVWNRRLGLLLSRTAYPSNPYGIPNPNSRSGSSGQTLLSEFFFYDPIYNQLCAQIERRGCPIGVSGDTNVYFTPQNGGTTPTDADRSRYATITYFDYQKNLSGTITGNSGLQSLLGLDAGGIATLISFVSGQMSATDGTGGIPAGFAVNLGDINGDGTGDGTGGGGSGLPASNMLGNAVKISHPSVTQFASPAPSIYREELFTTNNRGQTTTQTDPNGNLTVFVRYPYNDPEGNGGILVPESEITPTLGGQQYGRMKEIHVDADPNDVLSLVGSAGDLVDFTAPVSSNINRTNTPGVYQDLVTRYEGGSGAGGSGCASCAYDPMGNPLAVTDPRGFTTRFDRNELGEAYRTISPQPYNFRVEMYFDANRNVVRVDTEDLQPAYDSSDPTSARFAQFTPSGSNNTAHVAMQPGPGGSVRPGWFTNLYTFDILDNKTQEDIDATGSTPSNLITSFAYDSNENLIQITKPESNIVEMDYDERNLKIATRVGRDAATSEPGAITVTVYDGNANVIQVISPLTNGASSGNEQTVTIGYAFGSLSSLTYSGVFALENTLDGFDRVILATDAVGGCVDTGQDITSSGDAFLDPDGRVILSKSYGTTGGATPEDRSGDDNVLLATAVARFDEGGRRYEVQGNVFYAGPTLNSGRSVTHNGGGLATNSTANDNTAAAVITSGETSYVLTRNIFDPGGRTVTILADNTIGETISQTLMAYDGANRRILITDALNNTVAKAFDADSNLIGVVRTEVSTIGGAANEVFSSAMYYDCLGQLVLAANQGADGNLNPNVMGLAASVSFWDMLPWNVASSTLISCMAQDSRGNAVLAVDAKGNSSVGVFDGASRAIQDQQHLRQTGQGANPPCANQTLLPGGGAVITTTFVLDGNGRQTQLIDDRGGTTRQVYDTLDREVAMIFQDGSTRTKVYDEASDVTLYTDENGSQFANTFDALRRKVAVGITLASSSVSPTTNAQAFQFDGRSRLTDARNNGTATLSEVQLFYDSLSRILEDSQSFGGNTRDVTNIQFQSYPATQFQFPGASGRVITNIYDLLYRRKNVADAGPSTIAQWDFTGPARVARVALGNGLTCTCMNNALTNSAVQGGTPGVPNPPWVAPPAGQSADRLGYDGAGRMITKRYVNPTSETPTSAIVGFTTRYDRASNKYYERALHAENRSSLYEEFDPSTNLPDGGYDSLDRLLQYQRGTLSSTGGDGGNGGGSIASGGSITLPNTDTQRSYLLDGLGNWRNTLFTPQTGGTPTQQTEVRQHNGLNQITRRQNGASQTNLSYDGGVGASNGNLANDGTYGYIWDALNRLAQVNLAGTETVVAEYGYDALNRRIRKLVSATSATTDFIYTGWRCAEDRNPFGGEGSTDTLLMQYVWGRYMDELLQLKTLVSVTTGITGHEMTYDPDSYYPLQDLLYRTTATTNSSGAIVEAYDYDAYGTTLIFNAPGTGSNWWGADVQVSPNSLCQFLFTGQRLDAETPLYFYKRRYYSALLGRFLSRDPYVRAMNGNDFEYVESAPSGRVDAFGLESDPAANRKSLLEKATDKLSRVGIGNCPSSECRIMTIIVELPNYANQDIGHAGIGFPTEDTYYDFGPATPGSVEVPTFQELLAGEGKKVPGGYWWGGKGKTFAKVLEEIPVNAQGNDVLRFDVCLRKQGCDKTEDWWKSKMANPGSYNVPGVHCTSCVKASIDVAYNPKANPSDSAILAPEGLVSIFLVKNEKGAKNIHHTCGSNKGKSVLASKIDTK